MTEFVIRRNSVLEGDCPHPINNYTGLKPVYVWFNVHDPDFPNYTLIHLQQRYVFPEPDDNSGIYWKITTLKGYEVHDETLTFPDVACLDGILVGSAATPEFHVNLDILMMALSQEPDLLAEEVAMWRTITRALVPIVAELGKLEEVGASHVFSSLEIPVYLRRHLVVAQKLLKDMSVREDFPKPYLTTTEYTDLQQNLDALTQYLDLLEVA